MKFMQSIFIVKKQYFNACQIRETTDFNEAIFDYSQYLCLIKVTKYNTYLVLLICTNNKHIVTQSSN